MTTCVIYFYEQPDERELSDVAYQCSTLCMFGTLADSGIATTDLAGSVNVPDAEDVDGGAGSVGWGQCPGGAETQSDVHCSGPGCGELLWRGLSFYEDLRRQEEWLEASDHPCYWSSVPTDNTNS